jgi:uncharacterized protein
MRKQSQMLIEFRVENFRSFKTEQVFTMVASSDTTLPENTFETSAFPKNKLLTTAAIYGANASGKTNLIKALSFVEWFVTNSHRRDINAKIPVEPFLLDDTNANSPTTFELTFIHQSVRYQYGFVISSSKVIEEWLFAYPSSRVQRWFERKDPDQPGNFKTEDNSWDFRSTLKGENRSIALQTRPNVLFLSKAADSNHKQLKQVYDWFDSCLDTYVDIQKLPPLLTANMLKNNPALEQQVKNLLTIADLGISDFRVEEKELNLKDTSLENLPDDLRNFFQSDFFQNNANKTWQITMAHHTNNPAIDKFFPLQDESLGTERLFALAGIILTALEEGRVLVIDELDSSLHPMLVRYIVSLFHNPNMNPGGAQLIFNTHDVTLLESEFLRRDQIWLVEKDNVNASHLYPLSDFKPRKSEAFQKNYLQGRYGATPIIGNLAIAE